MRVSSSPPDWLPRRPLPGPCNDVGVSGTAVDRLAALVGPNGRSSQRPDWSSLHAAFGHRFPTDFQQYVERFPPGAVDFVQVFHPYERDFQGDPAVYVEQLLARTDPANDIEDWYRFGNAPGELFSWGTVNGEFELCWESAMGRPTPGRAWWPTSAVRPGNAIPAAW